MHVGMAANSDPPTFTLPPIATKNFLRGVRAWLRKSMAGGERPTIPRKMKVIDCVQRRIVLAPRGCVYIALSYVWGTNQACPSLGEKLPQTIEDSITTVLHLGHRYLWVDRYCIDQEAEIKHVQIQQMGTVYAGAVMTIIAYAGADPTFGLPGISSNIDRTIKWPAMRATGYLGTSIWLQRGWTFQENYLSERRLFFTEFGPVYMCKTSLNSEIFCDSDFVFKTMWKTIIDKQRPRRAPIDSEAALNEAENIMECYSKRLLGYESDWLNAIVGVLNTLSARHVPIRHIWGVPFCAEKTANGDIIRISLNWSSEFPGTRRSAFPSWSSLGWASPMTYRRQNTPYSCSEDFNLKIWQNDKFRDISKIEEGYQNAHCRDPESQRLLITAISVPADASLWINTDNSPHFHLIKDNLPLGIRPYWDDTKYARKPDSSVLCVFQSALSRFGLILKCHGKYYERVGYFTMGQKLDLFQHYTEKLCDKSLPGGSEATVANKSRLIERRTIELR